MTSVSQDMIITKRARFSKNFFHFCANCICYELIRTGNIFDSRLWPVKKNSGIKIPNLRIMFQCVLVRQYVSLTLPLLIYCKHLVYRFEQIRIFFPFWLYQILAFVLHLPAEAHLKKLK